MTGVTCGAGLAYFSKALEFTLGFSGVRVTGSLVFGVSCVDRCLSFCPFSTDRCIVLQLLVDLLYLLILLSILSIFSGRHQHLVEKYYVTSVQITKDGMRDDCSFC